jgi:hypothetical protein
VPPRAPFGSTLSTAFANEGLGGPAFPGIYRRAEALPMVEQGYGLEAWVKAGPTFLDSIRNNVIAYNGELGSNGFGLYLHADEYVVRIGTFQRALGPATLGEWHHLAYIQSLGTASYFYDGKLVHETTSDPLPVEAAGGFWLGGIDDGMGGVGHSLFNGWIDEVRYQSFNPLAAGAFGDYNGNGLVEQADLDLVLLHWGKVFESLPEEWTAERPTEGIIDQSELDGVLLHWGDRLQATSVPEPASAVLLILFGFFAARLGDHRQSGSE